ncbi:MAG: hypothetical protein WC025_00360 [Candidatus Magasanikbacteria bacterium]
MGIIPKTYHIQTNPSLKEGGVEERFLVKSSSSLFILLTIIVGGCDATTGTTGNDASTSCDGKQDNPACYVDVTTTVADTHVSADSAEDVCGDTQQTQEEETTPPKDYTGMVCPGLGGCILEPLPDGEGWKCGAELFFAPSAVEDSCF